MSSKKKSSSSKQANEQEQLAEAMSTDSSLETVRDILFGKQIRETKSKEQELEKLIKSSINDLNKQVQSQFKDMEKSINKLQKDIEKAADKTAGNVANEFEDTRAAIAELDASARTARSEMYDTLDTARLALEKDARAWVEELATHLDDVHAKVEYSKADRVVIAKLLGTMASELAGADKIK